MIVMTPEATDAQIVAVRERLASIERLHVLVLPGELTTAIGAIGDPEGVAELGLEGMPGVDRVVPISRPYKLASSEFGDRAPTALQIDGRVVGGGETFCWQNPPAPLTEATHCWNVANEQTVDHP